MSKTKRKGRRGLTPKQEAYARSYAASGNGTRAAAEAGYSPRWSAEQSYENLRKPHLMAAIDGYRASAIKSSEIDRDRVLRGLLQEAEAVGGRASDRISAWTALAKILGLMVDRHRVEALVSHQHVFEGLTKSDLLVLVEEGRAKRLEREQAIEGTAHTIE